MAEVEVSEEMMDFSSPRTEIRFRIDGDVFTAPRELPAEILAEFAERWENIALDTPIKDQMKMLAEMILMILDPEPGQLFVSRMGNRANPIGLKQVNDVITWLMEEYGMRPTLPSESLSAMPSLPGSGTSSTDTPPVVASTSSPSP